eukprot:5260800-Karenia_brevis.AAC.1
MVTKVELSHYAWQHYEDTADKFGASARLRRICNTIIPSLRYHCKPGGQKSELLSDPSKFCPKLRRIADDLRNCTEKALVLISRAGGLRQLVDLLQSASPRDPGLALKVATLKDLPAFNSLQNLRGDVFQVLVADSALAGEGLHFVAVRKLIIAEVPATRG